MSVVSFKGHKIVANLIVIMGFVAPRIRKYSKRDAELVAKVKAANAERVGRSGTN